MISIARTLGAPETVPAGKQAASAARASSSGPEPAPHLADQMHHVRVPLDRHERGEPDRAELRHPAHIVPAQVYQHQMLGSFLGIGQQLVGERGILLGRRAARPGSRDRPKGHFAILHPDQDLRRAADDVDIVAVEIVEVGSGVEGAEIAIGEERVRRRQIDPAGQHRLEGVARGDVLLDPAHVVLKLLVWVGSGRSRQRWRLDLEWREWRAPA